MLEVTEGAKDLLRDIWLEETDDPEFGLRLTMEAAGQLALVLSKEELGDHVVEHEGVKVLLVASELTPMVDGITFDVRDSADGPKLVAKRE